MESKKGLIENAMDYYSWDSVKKRNAQKQNPSSSIEVAGNLMSDANAIELKPTDSAGTAIGKALDLTQKVGSAALIGGLAAPIETTAKGIGSFVSDISSGYSGGDATVSSKSPAAPIQSTPVAQKPASPISGPTVDNLRSREDINTPTSQVNTTAKSIAKDTPYMQMGSDTVYRNGNSFTNIAPGSSAPAGIGSFSGQQSTGGSMQLPVYSNEVSKQTPYSNMEAGLDAIKLREIRDRAFEMAQRGGMTNKESRAFAAANGIGQLLNGTASENNRVADNSVSQQLKQNELTAQNNQRSIADYLSTQKSARDNSMQEIDIAKAVRLNTAQDIANKVAQDEGLVRSAEAQNLYAIAKADGSTPMQSQQNIGLARGMSHPSGSGAKWEKIGTDQLTGKDTYGWVDPSKRTVSPYNLNPIDQKK